MPFVTQGKTNWKFLLIVIIFAIIVGGGVLWYTAKQKISFPEFKKTEKVELNYQNLLAQMFPEKEFSGVKERSDCFQDQEDIFYCIESVKKDFLSELNKKNILVVVRIGYDLLEGEQPYYPHAAGMYHARISVFDQDSKKILAKSTELVADDGSITFYDCEGRTYTLFVGQSGGQGWCMGGASLFQMQDGKFKEVLPLAEEDLQDVILEPQDNKVSVYKRESVKPDFVCPTKCICEAPEIIGQAFVYSYDLKWDDNTCEFKKDATADWKTYRNEEYGFEIKYPQDWLVQDSVFIDPVNRQDFINKGIEPLTGAKFTSLGDPTLTVLLTVHNNYNNYTLEEWLKVCQETSPTGVSLGWKEEFSIAGEKGLKGGFGCCMTYLESAFLAKGNKIYQIEGGLKDLQAGTYENDAIFNQMLSTFRFIEEIKTGKVEIDYEEIKRIQQSVDEGSQPWRLNPVMVAASEAYLYGFTEDDIINTLSVPDVATQKKFGTEITETNLKIIHNGKVYILTLFQPIAGVGKIWTISDVEVR
jgi:hypothetical protein